jgi:hypothetical protein
MRMGPRQPLQLTQLAETQHTDHNHHCKPPDFASNDPAWAMGLPCPCGPPDFVSNDPAQVVGLPPPCVHIHPSPQFCATTQHGWWSCHCLSCVLPVHASPSISQAMTQDPAWAVGLPPPVLHPHRKPPILRNDPAQAVGLPPPVLHPHCPCKAP